MTNKNITNIIRTAIINNDFSIIDKYRNHHSKMFFESIKIGNLEFIKRLIDKDLNNYVKKNALFNATIRNKCEILKFLIECNYNLVYVDEFEDLISFASQSGSLDVIKVLIDNNVNYTRKNNESLLFALEFGHFEIVDYYLKLNPDNINIIVSFDYKGLPLEKDIESYMKIKLRKFKINIIC